MQICGKGEGVNVNVQTVVILTKIEWLGSDSKTAFVAIYMAIFGIRI